ncbi:hypothetical protein EV643_12318 [Kribbella sp. VKM Ac-2527]|uniref:Uncharacterized protein n=1 Tax=Kribbella caucasensis TaxID=2512215 RepID=A0A4R6JHL7_9ACTN|nr:hypothetical protein EV643_12318 [Kribbella sp. VKM Ac-2527]
MIAEMWVLMLLTGVLVVLMVRDVARDVMDR